MQSVLRRGADLQNISDAAAALAEIRALGAMLAAGMSPRPVQRERGSTPDFEANVGDGVVTVEVHAKHEDGVQADRRRALAAGEDVSGVERSSWEVGEYVVTHTVSVWYPGGAPDPNKPNDSVQTNLISKLCNVKGDERQHRNGIPALLWLDLSSFVSTSENLLEQTQPLESGPLGFAAGAIWYAFYGWKGAPIFEDWHRRTFSMAHEGRFRRSGADKSHLAATIICFERGLVLFENPWATVPLPNLFRSRCARLPWFQIGPSVCNWAPGSAAHQIELWKSQIEGIAAARNG